ncbi:phage tail protein [Streptomyces cucumeris]|uniref:phage tail protein n=1 Tax=Streptomyces cucumeris TaxID=2962890 RepID=UPI003D73E064
MTDLRAAAGNITVKARLDDQTRSGVASVTSSLEGLRAAATDIPVRLDDQTAPGIAAVTMAMDTLRAAAAEIEVRLDDQTASGVASVSTAIQTLKDESPIRLDVQFDGQAADITGTAAAVRDLKNDAQDAGQALTTLSAKAGLASAALEVLKDKAQSASLALRTLRGRASGAADALRDMRDGANAANRGLTTLNSRTQTADGRLDSLSGRTRALRSDLDDLDGILARVGGRMGDLRTRLGTLSTTAGRSGGSLGVLRATAISLAPALIPIAASAAPIAAKIGAASAAVAAFGIALIPQISAMGEAADAQKKYDQAVAQHGASSQQAAQAEAAYLQTVKKMPPATREAAAGLAVMKKDFSDWSDSLSKDTMAPVIHSFDTLRATFPKLSPVVKTASGELDRFVSVLAGGVASDGFDRFMEKFANFSGNTLHSATNSLAGFMKRLSEGGGRGALGDFMDYARRVGPQVSDTLGNIGQAAGHLLVASSDLGVSMLGIVNAMAKLVTAVPSGALSTFLQLALAFKAVQLAATGLIAVKGALTGIATAIGAMQVASAGAGGGLAGVGAAFGTLSRGAKLGVVAGGVALFATALIQLSKVGKEAPPDVDKLTTSLGKLATTGKASGEAARVFGADLGELYDSVRSLTDPSTTDKIQQGLVKTLSLGQWDSTPVEEAKEKIDAIDKALANLVKGGKGELAAAALKRLSAEYAKGGHSTSGFKKKLDDYKQAVEDAKFAQKLAADGMGLFGDQALATKEKLDAQKQSADGLRQSIQALNDVQRAGLGGMIGFEAAIDNAAKAAKENKGALSMTRGELNLNSEKARNAAAALQDLAQKTDEAAASSRESSGSWEGATRIYERGRAQLIKNAQAMGLTKKEAQQLAGQILKIPNKAMMLKADVTDFTKKIDSAKKKLSDPGLSKTKRAKLEANIDDWNAKLLKARAGLQSTPAKKVAKLTADISDWRAKVDAAQKKLKSAKGDKKAKLTADIGDWQSKIRAAERVLKGVPGGKRAVLAANISRWMAQISTAKSNLKSVPSSKRADLRAKISDLQSKVRAAKGELASITGKTVAINVVTSGLAAAKAGLAALGGPGFAHGGIVGGAASGGPRSGMTLVGEQGPEYVRLPYGSRVIPHGRTRSMLKSEREALGEVAGGLRRSHFGAMAGYKYTPIERDLGHPGSLGDLTGSLNRWRGNVQRTTHGSTERKLLRDLDVAGRALIKNAKLQEKVNAALEKAKDKLSGLKEAAASMKESVSSGILGSANITRSAGNLPEGRTLTTSDVMGGLVESRDKAKSFAGALAALKKKGLNKQLLADIAAAGIEGGGLQTATALMRASSSDIKRMNDLQGQIGSSAAGAGKTAADAMYGAGIKTAEGVVKGLEKNKKKIEKAMDGIAKALESAIRKALNVKKRAHGGIVGAAGGGPRSALTLVGEQGPELVKIPFGSTVIPNGRSRQMMRGSGPAEPVVIELRSSGNEVDEFLLKILRRAIKVRGGNAQIVLAGRPA